MADKVINITKYDLWNLLFTADDKYKTDEIRKLEEELNNSMRTNYRVRIEY